MIHFSEIIAKVTETNQLDALPFLKSFPFSEFPVSRPKNKKETGISVENINHKKVGQYE